MALADGSAWSNGWVSTKANGYMASGMAKADSSGLTAVGMKAPGNTIFSTAKALCSTQTAQCNRKADGKTIPTRGQND